ncbi:hypothetical protein VIGAN_10110700 [Vigna angularis var. angularis]|uniref:Uncharacterized protein n=1 Tax=Vigna angularis var. angularis TaxID=157739 RepID=A0A0S3T394_PHAAN|nr:hypothetical protein VIGAN_10110700 [Vigna angularis var. angularis]
MFIFPVVFTLQTAPYCEKLHSPRKCCQQICLLGHQLMDFLLYFYSASYVDRIIKDIHPSVWCIDELKRHLGTQA